MNKKVTTERFCNEFREQWNVEKEKNTDGILNAYKEDRTWTDFMLNMEVGFLFQLSQKLGLKMDKEWYTMDCVYYEETPNLYDKGFYPACLHVYIEHENGDSVEEEMWKLLLFRSPLKVLIFYDYPEYAKNTKVT